MREHIFQTGTDGEIKIVDRTDEDDMLVEMQIRCAAAIDIPELPWLYSVDGNQSNVWSHHLLANDDWQVLDEVFILGDSSSFTFKILDTGFTEMNGPAEFTVDLLGAPSSGLAYVLDGTWKPAEVYVNVRGVWRHAQPFVRDQGIWRQVE